MSWGRPVYIKIKLDDLDRIRREKTDLERQLQDMRNDNSRNYSEFLRVSEELHQAKVELEADAVVPAPTREVFDTQLLAAAEYFDLYPPSQKTAELGAPPATWKMFADELWRRLNQE